MEISNQIIIVTGGAKGIGKGIAKELIRNGAKVVVLDIDKIAIETLKKEEDTVYCLACDITNEKEVASTIDNVQQTFGRIDCLVNNAGVIHNEPLINLFSKTDKKHSLDSWERVIRLNLTSVFLVTLHVVEKMVAHRIKGVVVNISSICAKGNTGQSAYSASKAGVNALTTTWAKELGSFGIRAVGVSPGFIDTESTKNSMKEELIDKWKKKIPLKKLGKVEHIASAVLFALQNPYLTGKVLEIDGGLTF
tara:strand:- start:458 stop:1207 length:750 start_codon:yes stop_codon:yes gene_type:complete